LLRQASKLQRLRGSHLRRRGARNAFFQLVTPSATAVSRFVQRRCRILVSCSIRAVAARDLCRLPALVADRTAFTRGSGGRLCVCLAGCRPACSCGGGGRVGDAVLVTGRLGGSIEGKHLNFTPRLDKAKWLTEHFSLHAMMDISDGLASDLPRLAKVSACDYHLEYDQIPCSPGCSVDQALSDGEDYELLFTLGKSDIDDLLSAWEKQFPDLPLTVIGELISGSVSSHFHSQRGWQHFRS